MVDTALVWISLAALCSIVAATACVLHYIQASDADYTAFAVGMVCGGGAVELGMANGYLPESDLFNAVVVVCVGAAVLAWAIGVKRQQEAFQVLRDRTL